MFLMSVDEKRESKIIPKRCRNRLLNIFASIETFSEAESLRYFHTAEPRSSPNAFCSNNVIIKHSFDRI